MARFELKLPKMGESVAEATITNWLKSVGDSVEMDEAILEIATDKVDSEVPTEVSGVLVEQLFAVDDVVEVGSVLAIIETKETDVSTGDQEPSNGDQEPTVDDNSSEPSAEVVQAVSQPLTQAQESADLISHSSSQGRFYSPLVRNIAQQEGISQTESFSHNSPKSKNI